MKRGFSARQVLEVLALILVVGALLIRLLVYRPVEVQGRSMLPTLHEHDQLLVNTWAARGDLPPRGTIVVLKSPKEGEWVVKRVVGLPGDKVELGPWGLRLNGKRVLEPYAVPYGGEVDQPPVVPADAVYVLGDNRPESNDSRDFGAVPRDLLVGTAVAVLQPSARRRWLPPAASLQ